jgi:hypothetical protein
MIEIMSLRLAAGQDEAEFVAADRRVREEFARRQPGLLGRDGAR